MFLALEFFKYDQKVCDSFWSGYNWRKVSTYHSANSELRSSRRSSAQLGLYAPASGFATSMSECATFKSPNKITGFLNSVCWCGISTLHSTVGVLVTFLILCRHMARTDLLNKTYRALTSYTGLPGRVDRYQHLIAPPMVLLSLKPPHLRSAKLDFLYQFFWKSTIKYAKKKLVQINIIIIFLNAQTIWF